MTNLNSHILVRLISENDFIAILTYQRGIGRKGRFFIRRNALRKWLNGKHKRPFYDMDCGNVLAILSDGDTLDFRMYWLSNSYGKLMGDEQLFSIPLKMMQEVVTSETAVRYLHMPKPCNPRIKLHIRHETMERIFSEPLTRRAFCKSMRDRFHWRDESITLYYDGGADFFFRTSSGCPACGGLIMHETTINTPHGQFPKVCYSIHT